ncbi:hypothetical protein QEZ54_27790 [Catellatospora sp. KI3]|uniref:hypothetical protein n=1 Tax=Catellatospora sp. KI3 TaxID=3041620 RepID=UPI002483018D|nr:hypothetical protein [Catellatospora sp. KI3]MDI1464779.1 hypothetical protein [Catellatospora sp. KI3]
MRATSKVLMLVALATALLASACGATTDVAGASKQAVSGSATAAATPAAAPAASPAVRISANTATEKDIAAALGAVGVANPGRWAEEVVEYRPYDAADVKLDRLRQKLAKYKPGDDTMNKILSALKP